MTKITESEWQDCYDLYRALRDGVCPQCGHIAEVDDIEDFMGNLTCESYVCDFTMTALESEIILSHSKEILKKRLDTFQRVRANLTLARTE